jgi:polysaccharide export outer membrane protein
MDLFSGSNRDIVKMASKNLVITGILALVVSCTALGQAAAGSDQVAQPPAASASSQPQPVTPSAKSTSDDNYVIGNDDMLGINVWKEPDFNQSIPVRSDGKISLPLIGEVQVSGRTPLQVKEEITEKLRSFLTAPDVTVMVLQMNSKKYNVLGRVARPGSYSLLATTTVLDAIAQAGGFQEFAKQKAIYILRRSATGGETRISFNYKDVIRGSHPEENIKLQPNDTIVVP